MREFIAAGMAVAVLASAGEGAAQDTGATTVLEPIYVTTPLRRPSTIVQSTSTVTVVTEEDIERSAAVDLPSLLRSYPGVNVTTNGGMGANAGITLRGTNTGQTLVLVDGMRVASATGGSTAIANIPLSSIARVEIVEGAHSAQWGADAIGGVVNIITKDGSFCENGASICSSVETGVTWPWGGFGTLSSRGVTGSGVDFNVGLSVIGTEGYDFTTPSNSVHEPGRDGFLQGSFNYSIGKDFAWGRVYSQGFYARSNPHFDSAPYADWMTGDMVYGANQSIQTNAAFKLGAEFDHSDDWSSVFEIYSAFDYQKNFRDDHPEADTHYDTNRFGISGSTTKEVLAGDALNIFTLGFDAYRETVDSSVDYTETGRNVGAFYGQYGLELDALTVNAGLRYDADEQFGGALTYNVGLGYELVEGLTARASFSTGFNAPTFNDLYWAFDGSYVGNPYLDPETSKNWEAGLNWDSGAGSVVDVVYYENYIDDMIVFVSDPITYIGTMENIEKAKVSGVRATYSQMLLDDRLGLDFGLEYRLPKNETDDEYIANQNRLKLTAAASWQATERLNLNAGIEYVGSRWTNESNFNPQLGDYTVVDISANYAVDDLSNVKFAVENLFDEDYQTIPGYNAPGTTVTLSYRRTF
ncbi:TonB-dependent receptor [Martelella mediterranea]|uniref:TonB-dependent receptor domain-containing protein n=1 Tax=Martelella mediterranea TaxID=293089 RepID=UPI001E5352C3|nr:TonB-dependent receptor [Martelella mediterranea]MCD1633827.1 TonB-dependent receptor [Martelella mediterranea]